MATQCIEIAVKYSTVHAHATSKINRMLALILFNN